MSSGISFFLKSIQRLTVHRLCWCKTQVERSFDHLAQQVLSPVRDEHHLLVKIQLFSSVVHSCDILHCLTIMWSLSRWALLGGKHILVRAMIMNYCINHHVPAGKKGLMLLQLLQAAGHLLPQKKQHICLIGQNCLEAIKWGIFLSF